MAVGPVPDGSGLAGRPGGFSPGDASPPARSQSFFEHEAPLVFTLEADFAQLKQDRSQESEERPGRVFLRGAEGELSLPVQVRTRGRFRLNAHICSFPPLRLDFPRDSLTDTPLAGLNKVKLVTHCRDSDTYEQNVLEEYLAYRLYGLLTDVSFRVRLATITYRDLGGEEEEVTRLAFLIEDEDAVAERLGGQVIETERANPTHLVPRQAGLMYLFQFLIGNTDWAVAIPHNMKFLVSAEGFYPLPYDFDFSGFVNTTYAGPSPVVARYISNVRERHFWGVCTEGIDYPSLYAHFNERREAMVSLVRNQPNLTDRNARLAEEYIESFFQIINDPRDADFRIVNGCRSMGG